MATAAIESMREEDWVSLTASIKRGRCVLMLGPGAFTADFGGEHLPVAVGLARFVQERLVAGHGDQFAELDPADPPSVARAALDTEDPTILGMWIEEFYERYDTTSEPFRKLASLPFSLVVNTSPGFSAERAFREQKPPRSSTSTIEMAARAPSCPTPPPRRPSSTNSSDRSANRPRWCSPTATVSTSSCR